jgi:hypothetical protein
MLPVSNIGIDTGVLLFTLGIVVASGLLFGIGPALWSRRRVPADVLKEGGRGATGSRLRRWSHGLAVAELAIAVMLMTGAGLLVRSWWRVQDIEPGLEAEGVLSVAVNLPPGRFDSQEKRDGFYDEVLVSVAAIPGVVWNGHGLHVAHDPDVVVQRLRRGWKSAGRFRYRGAASRDLARIPRGVEGTGPQRTNLYRRGHRQCSARRAHQ